MSYFLRIRKNKKGNYLSIVDSKHVTGMKGNQSRVIKTLGYEETLITDEIKNPIEYYRNYCKELNRQRNLEKNKERETIGEDPLVKNIGYFLIKKVLDKLNIRPEFNAFTKLYSNYKCDIYQIYSDLIFSRVVKPESKNKTYEKIIDTLFGLEKNYSLDDIYNALTFIGENYETILSFLTYHTNNLIKLDTSTTLFDCTNFYFEIDKQDDFRKKGPSKENRNEPLVGMALLLDKHAIPINMKIYPGNQSEINKLPETLDEMKKINNIKGRTIQVADKGLNCGRNIFKALSHKDGYLFSKSVLKSSNIEKTWYKIDKNWKNVYDENKELKYSYSDWVGDFTYEYKDDDGINQKITVKEKRIITYNPKLARKKLLELEKITTSVKDLIACKAKKERFGPYSEYIDLKTFDKNGELIEGKIFGLLNTKKIEEEKKLAGFNVLVTSEIGIDTEEIYNLYHQLRKIEHTFRIMKSDLSARPVYLQKQSTITGHFMIVYTAVLLIRILETYYLKGKVNSNDLFNFIRDFNIYEMPNGDFANFLSKINLIEAIAEKIPEINFKYLKKNEIIKLLNI